MKKQVNLWLVLGFTAVALSIVYALSITSPQSGATASTPEVVQKPVPQARPAIEPAPELSLSPDLTKTNAYQLLDLVPLGKKAPNFTVKTAEGKTLRLSDLLGKKNVVMTFYQGSFCSVCGAQLTNFQKHLSDFKNQDAEIIAISADDATHAMQTVGEHGLTFPVVPDPDKKLIKLFGVGNVSKKGIAWPSAYVLDKKGIVKLSFASPEGHRLHSNEILPVLSKMTGKPAPKLGYQD